MSLGSMTDVQAPAQEQNWVGSATKDVSIGDKVNALEERYDRLKKNFDGVTIENHNLRRELARLLVVVESIHTLTRTT